MACSGPRARPAQMTTAASDRGRRARSTVLAAVVLAATAAPLPGWAIEDSRPNPRTQALVEDLRRVVDQAAREGAASADVLEDLRALIARYDAPYAQLVIRDTFQDGSFLSDPPWRVLSGEWQAVAGSVVTPPTGPALVPARPDPEDTITLQEKLGAVSRLVEQLSEREAAEAKGKSGGSSPEPPLLRAEREPLARLGLPVHVPEVFRLRTRVRLEDEPDRHAVAISVRDRAGEVGYRVLMESFASRTRVRLEKTTTRGARTLGSEVLTESLAGGPVYTVMLERDRQGTLAVRVHGVLVVAAQDRASLPLLEQVMLEREAGRLIVSEVEVWTPVR